VPRSWIFAFLLASDHFIGDISELSSDCTCGLSALAASAAMCLILKFPENGEINREFERTLRFFGRFGDFQRQFMQQFQCVAPAFPVAHRTGNFLRGNRECLAPNKEFAVCPVQFIVLRSGCMTRMASQSSGSQEFRQIPSIGR
jgi:hypothetical protein